MGIVDHQRYTPDGTPLPDDSTGPVLDVRSVEPVFVQDTSDATVTVVVCTMDPVPAHWKVPVTASDPPLGCTSVAPFTPRNLDVNPKTHQLMIAVTPHKAGAYTMDGANVDYHDGVRSGHQRVGEHLRVSANA